MSNEPTQSDIRSAHSKAVGGARPRCNKGKSCSAACITRTDFCLVEIPISPSQATSKVRDEIESSKNKQLPLFDVASRLRKKDIEAGVNEFKRRNQEDALRAIKNGSEKDYEKHRQQAISFNRRLVEDGMTKKVGLVNVPVSWEKVQKVKASYEKAYDSITRRVTRAALSGKRAEYLREERKLLEMQRKIGDKVGSNKKYEKGSIWFENYESPSRSKGFLRSLRRNPDLYKFSMDYYRNGATLDLTTYVKNTSGGQSYRVEIMMTTRGTDFSFTVNGSYDRPPGLSRRDGITISTTVKNAFREIAKSMSMGSVITCSPYEGDGLGDKRRSLYKAAGFKDGPDGVMYARIKDKAGNTAPASEADLRKFIEKGRFNFAE